MDQGLIPKRYAKAIYEVAQANSSAQKLYQQMQALAAAFAAEPKLSETMNNPFVADSDKAALVRTAAGAKAGDKDFDAIIRLLTTNHRIGMVRDIATAYLKIYRKANKIYIVEVEAAAPMASAEEQRLKDLIQQHLGKDATMEYQFHVDPELIGGFVVKIDNERLDASVKNELKQLRLKLLGNK